jgi:hypothetical protein
VSVKPLFLEASTTANVASSDGHRVPCATRRDIMIRNVVAVALAPALAAGALALTTGSVVASADPLPYGPDTCIDGFVWRNARDGDPVCVTPSTRDMVAQENADPGAHKDPNGAYGPQSCAQGYVWRQAFDGDTICVTPDIRSQTLADNAAAASRKAANKPAPQASNDTVVLKATGGGTARSIDVYDPDAEPRQYDVALPFTHSRSGGAKSGQLYEIVVLGKDGAQPGCSITSGNQVVVSQPAGGSGQCVWVAP